MKKKKNNKELFILILGAVLIITSIGMFMRQPEFTGAAIAAAGSPQESNVTINTAVLECNFNDTIGENNLTAGIFFDSSGLTPNTADNQATGNENGTGTNTTYAIYTGSSNTANLDFWIRADADLICHEGTGNCTTETIAVDTNYSYDDATTSANPGPADNDNWLSSSAWEIADSTDIGVDTQIYWRFWLDVPFGTVDGTYNNTIRFLCNRTSS